MFEKLFADITKTKNKSIFKDTRKKPSRGFVAQGNESRHEKSTQSKGGHSREEKLLVYNPT